MAVAEEVHVMEADSSSSSTDDGSSEAMTDEASCASSSFAPLPEADNHDLLNDDDDNDELKLSSVKLSNEALKLLRHASRSVMKGKQKRRKASSLYKELQSLRNLIPPHTFGDINTEPCVISDALGYLKILKQEIEVLKDGLVKPIDCNLRASQDAQAEVMSSDQRIEIHVSCNKRTGLLADLLLVLESTGLVFDDVDASCHHRLHFQASSTQKGADLLDKQAIRRAILRVIHKK